MKARVADLSPRARIAIAAAAVLVYALALWFLLVAPQARRGDEARGRRSSRPSSGSPRRASTATRPRKTAAPRDATCVRLAKAMPSSADQPSLVLELDRPRAPRGRDARLDRSARAPTIDGSGATLVPVVVSVSGSYGRITTLPEVRARARRASEAAELRASGRLFSVQGVELSESSDGQVPAARRDDHVQRVRVRRADRPADTADADPDRGRVDVRRDSRQEGTP